MRLLDVHEFPPPAPKDSLSRRRYAILSHTWQENEVVFSDLRRPDEVIWKQASWDKIRGAQAVARQRKLDYIWIDSLCIDKRSSSELGEAINSMFAWYQQAVECYVYLSDVDSGDWRHPGVANVEFQSTSWYVQFKRSRWFKRGWTLQELVAPSIVRFYDRHWNFLGDTRRDNPADRRSITKFGMEYCISKIARISISAMRSGVFDELSVAERLSWAAFRKTTKPEDRAYSLLGILQVNLDIRYGEGSNAFIRLQEEIMARSTDQSLLAWGLTVPLDQYTSWVSSGKPGKPKEAQDEDERNLLASDPDCFAHSHEIIPCGSSSQQSTLTNLGLRIIASTIDRKWVLLNCQYRDDPTLAILLNADLAHYPLASNSVIRLQGRTGPQKGMRLITIDVAAMHAARSVITRELTICRKTPRVRGSGPDADLVLLLERSHQPWRILQRSFQPLEIEQSVPRPYSHYRLPTFDFEKTRIINNRLPIVIHLKHPSGFDLRIGVGRWALKIDTHTQQGLDMDLRSKSSTFLPITSVQFVKWNAVVVAVLDKQSFGAVTPYTLTVGVFRPSLPILGQHFTPDLWQQIEEDYVQLTRVGNYLIGHAEAVFWSFVMGSLMVRTPVREWPLTMLLVTWILIGCCRRLASDANSLRKLSSEGQVGT